MSNSSKFRTGMPRMSSVFNRSVGIYPGILPWISWCCKGAEHQRLDNIMQEKHPHLPNAWFGFCASEPLRESVRLYLYIVH